MRQFQCVRAKCGVSSLSSKHWPLRFQSLLAPPTIRRSRFPLSSRTAQLATDSQAAPAQTVLHLPPELADYRPNVGMCVVNSQGLVFAATRVDDSARSWQMPQGGIDPGEEALHAALRELWEETSISNVQLVAEASEWLPYEFPPSVRCRLGGTWAKYKGQAQRWFLFRFTGQDAEINLDTSHKEFSEWRWMPIEQLPESVVHFKKSVYDAVVDEFGPAVAAIKREHTRQ